MLGEAEGKAIWQAIGVGLFGSAGLFRKTSAPHPGVDLGDGGPPFRR